MLIYDTNLIIFTKKMGVFLQLFIPFLVSALSNKIFNFCVMLMNILNLFDHYTNLFLAFLPNVLLAMVTLIVGFWLIGKVSDYISKALKKTNSDATVIRFLTSLVSIGLKIMLFLSIATLFGIQTTSFIAVFTALAFSLGTALSGNIGHFASGIMILIFRPYKVGDEITVQNYNGIVTDIQVFHTTLITTDNRKIIVPNGQITSGVITNFSHENKIRMNIVVNVADDSNLDLVKKIILQLSEANTAVMKAPECKILVNSFNKNGVEIFIRPWCKPIDANNIHFYFQESLRKAFLEHGIQGPTDALDVAIKQS
jgi:small conductance mechanosensitive channel